MCGICGLIALEGQLQEPERALLERMTDSLAHRGPSDRGTFVEGRAGLGSRRLSVIDLSENGHMPMPNEDASVHIVYNGEVYNFAELEAKHGLRQKGHVFRSRTDTEVLLHLYEEIGTDMFAELNGMFAIAIWDGPRQRLVLGRDRFGIKPLFFQRDAQRFRFGSEIKAILQDERVPRQPSAQALWDFLTFDYIPGTQTAFEGIEEVPASHFTVLDADGSSRTERYWDLVFDPDRSLREPEVVERALELMQRSIERRLIADVPIGVLLSGGLDSSACVALMHEQTQEQVHTFSVGFEDPSFNELPWARIAAQSFDTAHKEVLVTADLVRELLPRVMSFIDEPYADGSAIPTYAVCEIAKDDVVVVLSGEGGDETFAGYDTYAAYNVYSKFRRLPGFLRNGVLAPIIRSLPVSHKKLSLEFKLKRFISGQDLPPAQAHMWWRIVLTAVQKQDVLTQGVREQLASFEAHRHFTEAFDRCASPETLSKIMYIDNRVFLPDDLMIKNDRMSMAHSLEARVPFTDPELCEFMGRVPVGMKLKGTQKKRLMKMALRDKLPDSLIQKKKVGLEMPYSSWFRNELKPLLLETLAPDRLEATGLFQPAGVQRIVDDHLEGRVDHGRALWGLVNYMTWHDLYIRG